MKITNLFAIVTLTLPEFFIKNNIIQLHANNMIRNKSNEQYLIMIIEIVTMINVLLRCLTNDISLRTMYEIDIIVIIFIISIFIVYNQHKHQNT